MPTPAAPLFRDPVMDGAADPVIVWNHKEKQWWIIYTARCATLPGPGVTWIHGCDLGVASSPDGHEWVYRGTLELSFEPGRNTWWAPEIVYYEGLYHMYPSYVVGMPTNWNHGRDILHYTSVDMWNWTFEGKIPLSSNRVIDACVAQMPGGGFRMWYKDEGNHSYTYCADSVDLYNWQVIGPVIQNEGHEGPNVFSFAGAHWMVCDYWKGLGVHRSDDMIHWTWQGLILDKPGTRAEDQAIAHHADVLVVGEEAYIFYFTHPAREGATLLDKRRSSVQVARLTSDGKMLRCDRDAPFDFELPTLPNGEKFR